MSKTYDKNSIESLSPLEFTRLKPGVYAGDTTYSTQLLVEILSNAIDEYRLGNGNQIDIRIDKDIIIVEDYGQGFIPNSFREDGKTILEAAFSVLNTSGKYREDGTYEGTSLGSFGIGSKITTFLSHWLRVDTHRNGIYESIWFKEGVFEKRDSGKTPLKDGTTVSWQPSEEFFTHTEVEIDKVESLLQTLVCLCPGLTINLYITFFNNNGIEDAKYIRYHSEKGLDDLVDLAVKNTELLDDRFHLDYSQGKNHIDLVLAYTSKYSSIIIPYVNTGLTESGQHITQIKTSITRVFNKFFKEKGWLKENDDNLTGDDIQEGMYIVFNITAPNVAYDAQVKSRITKIDMTPFIPAFSEELEYWLYNNEKDIKGIFDKAITARRAREAAKKARETARGQAKKKEKAVKFDTKLADCFSKDRLNCEIYIVEGDSAAANLKTARDNEFQAVLPVRGKILNTYKATLDKIQKNAEIMSMIDAFGLSIDTKSMKVTYHRDDLRYGKIIIMSDADVDGAHIKNLFYTFIWSFCPELIEDGYVYAGVPPLYKITTSSGYKYLKNDEELELYRQKNVGKKYTVNRLKGLGEMGVEETEETLVDPDSRILHKVTVNDRTAAAALFDDLMGTKVIPRKEFIKVHSKEATYAV